MVWTPPETSLPCSVCNINYSKGSEFEKLEGASYAEQREKSAGGEQEWETRTRIKSAEPRKLSQKSSEILQGHTLGKKIIHLRCMWRSVLENG